MAWTLLIKALIEATTEYLKLRYKTVYLDVFHKSYDKQDEYIKEVEKLRVNRTPADLERISVLMQRLQQERARLDDLSALITQTTIKPNN